MLCGIEPFKLQFTPWRVLSYKMCRSEWIQNIIIYLSEDRYLLSSYPKSDFVLDKGSGRRGSRFHIRPLPKLSFMANQSSLLEHTLTILPPFTRPKKTCWPLCLRLHQISIPSGLMFESDTCICSSFIHILRDAICDGTAVWEDNRQVALAQSDVETRLLVLLTVVPRRAVKGQPREPLRKWSMNI